jgi:2-hydroxy-3-keto-5-methylthiopentenyl-1-phosphate phosphatase
LEEVKVLLLEDENAKFKLKIEEQEAIIDRLREKLTNETNKIVNKISQAEILELSYREKIKAIEDEKKDVFVLLSGKEMIVDRLSKEVVRLEAIEKSRLTEIEELNKSIEKLKSDKSK